MEDFVARHLNGRVPGAVGPAGASLILPVSFCAFRRQKLKHSYMGDGKFPSIGVHIGVEKEAEEDRGWTTAHSCTTGDSDTAHSCSSLLKSIGRGAASPHLRGFRRTTKIIF